MKGLKLNEGDIGHGSGFFERKAVKVKMNGVGFDKIKSKNKLREEGLNYQW